MLRRSFLPILAVLGALLGLYVVFWTQKSVPTPPIFYPPPRSPYPSAIAAVGLIEASSENISVGSPFNEVIEKIYVVEGDIVQQGDLLFSLDTRNFAAQVETAKAALQAAVTDLENTTTQFAFYERLNDKSAVSQQAYEQYRYAMLQAQDAVLVAKGTLDVARSNIERSNIRAPIARKILQVNIHVGEIAPVTPIANSQSTWLANTQGSLILMGAIEPLQLRVDIDEADAWRFIQGARGTAFVRGNSLISFPISFFRLEPYIIPKSSFYRSDR